MEAEERDLELALRLQELWAAEDEKAAAAASASCPQTWPEPPPPARPLSVVDEAWELLDPSPDVRSLFVQFNETLFWGRLAAVEVSWSPRMTLCAGVCRYEGKGGMCSIRLSEPLLKLRPRKDLVETLLHEMIHALLFVTNNDKDRDSHGPEFRKHMRRINRLTGANITTLHSWYQHRFASKCMPVPRLFCWGCWWGQVEKDEIAHSFHDEVDLYRQHWWRCNGPCQNRKPYFGYVKRSMNRPPSARDFWWAEHQETCGGTFTKVKEPENYSQKSKEKTQSAKLPNSVSTNKGKTRTCDMQDLMPFSGKGYRLGGGDSGLPERATNSSSSASETPGSPRCPAVRTIPIPKNEIKFETSPRSGVFFPAYTDDASEKIKLASKREFPKLSVANTKAYKNIDGSPLKIARVVEETSNQGSAKGKNVVPFYNRPLNQICFEQTVPPQVASEKKISKRINTPQQWPKTEDKTAFGNYFIKKENAGVTVGINTPVKTKAESTVSSASSSTAVRQDEKVCCPVCQAEVLESRINEHLDSCLA